MAVWDPAGPRPVARGARIVFIDLARAITVLMMVQGHALHVFLASEFKQNALFESWRFVRGLTAPMFLLLAGFSFSIATIKRWPDYLQLGPRVRRRLQRFAFFLLLGYVIHIPVRPIFRMASMELAGWWAFLRVDVLQCIAFTLVLLQLLVYLTRSPRRFAVISALLGIAIIGATPLVRGVEWKDYLWAPAAAFLYSGVGSLFPLFGWSAFILLGAALGAAYVQRQELFAGREERWTLGLAAVAIAAGTAVRRLFGEQGVGAMVHEAKSSFLLYRFGGVMVLLSIFCRISRRVERLVAPLQALAEESLVIYVLHLAIFYGSIWSKGLRHTSMGGTLVPWEIVLMIVAALSSMVVVAYYWNRFKKTYPRGKQIARAGIAVALGAPLL